MTSLDIDKIREILPHRHPFLLLDRIEEHRDGEWLRAIKNVTISEPFFPGHFPHSPVMPGVLILEAMAQASAVLDRAAGITLGQWRVLAFIGSGDARTSRAIAAASGLDPAQISRSLKALEADGLIAAERLAEDRRTLALSLTEKGREAFDAILPIMQARQRHLMDALSAEERKVILSALEKLEIASERRDFGQ